VMRDRRLVAETRGWGRSVHAIQHMPPANPRNTGQTTAAIVMPPPDPGQPQKESAA
jgi:dihydroorotase